MTEKRQRSIKQKEKTTDNTVEERQRNKDGGTGTKTKDTHM
jgi:hypothetical protein